MKAVMKIKPIQAIEAYKKNPQPKSWCNMKDKKRKLTLSPEEAEHVRSVVDFIPEFESDDYEDWVKDTGNPEGHVYYHAWKLNQILN